MDEIAVRLELIDGDRAPERLEEAIAPLLEDLRRLGAVQEVRAEADGAAGAKGDPVTMAGIVVALIASPVLTALVGLAHDWLVESRHRSVKLTTPAGTLEIDRASAGDQQRLIEQWIAASNRPAVEAGEAAPSLEADGPGRAEA